MQKLILCNSVEYAYMVANLFLQKPSIDQLTVMLVAKALDSKCAELAQKLVDSTSDPTLRCILNAGLKQSISLSKSAPQDF